MVSVFVYERWILKNVSRLLGFFSSIKLTVVLLVVLSVTSILGTVIPQSNNPGVYLQYDHGFYNFLGFIGLFDMYHSWWFRVILFMLSINILICTFKRLPGVWNFVFSDSANRASGFVKFSQNLEFILDKNLETASGLCHSAISSEFRYWTSNRLGDSVVIHAEIGRWTRLGVYIVHLSIVLLFLGGLLSSVFGFEGYTNVTEGDTSNWVKLKGSNRTLTLDFGIRCDSFGIEFHENGVPKEYSSELSLIERGVTVAKKRIVVNDPMHYNGINIFQSSYGQIPLMSFIKSLLLENLYIDFKSNITGLTYTEKLEFGVPIDLPEDLGKFCVLEYVASANFKGVDLGRTLKCTHLLLSGESPETILLPLDFPNFDFMRGGAMVCSLSSQLREKVNLNNQKQTLYYTGLQVTKDPGKWIVYTAFSLIMLGFIITFLMSHKQIYIKVSGNEENSKIIVSGHTNSNKLAMKELLDRIHDFML